MNIGIIDYGMGNLRSVQWALEHLGLSTHWIASKDDWGRANAVVLPGVGAFGLGMQELSERDLTDPIAQWLDADLPFLGICLGFQFLFEGSNESQDTRGFGVLPGKIERLENKDDLKVPQIGWNDIQAQDGIWQRFSGQYFYFVHSYAAPLQGEGIIATTHYGREFASAVAYGNIWGTQFHPERSGQAGLSVLQTFIEQAQ